MWPHMHQSLFLHAPAVEIRKPALAMQIQASSPAGRQAGREAALSHPPSVISRSPSLSLSLSLSLFAVSSRPEPMSQAEGAGWQQQFGQPCLFTPSPPPYLPGVYCPVVCCGAWGVLYVSLLCRVVAMPAACVSLSGQCCVSVGQECPCRLAVRRERGRESERAREDPDGCRRQQQFDSADAERH
ncbi:hypothetical protein GGR56DRAFT_498064 [Xylariaceae sp. FL0804]|nr:hypothetical protein GGR56DRAFT_498064 [Xylariaceae sp. FL0804]